MNYDEAKKMLEAASDNNNNESIRGLTRDEALLSLQYLSELGGKIRQADDCGIRVTFAFDDPAQEDHNTAVNDTEVNSS